MNIRPEMCIERRIRPSLRGVSARARIDGLMLRMDLQQTYVNAGTDPLEVVFTFPLPLAATLLGLDAELAGRKLSGTVMGRERAEQCYEHAIEDGDSAILVECARDGLYTVNLGNLLPGDTLRLTLRYGQLLRFEQGIVRVTLPTTLGQWYGDASAQGGLAQHQVPLTGGVDDYPFDLSIRIAGTLADARAECVTHALALRHEGADLVASLAARAWLDRDFVLTLSGLPSLSAAVCVPDYAASEGDAAADVVIASLCPRIGDATQARVDLKLLVDCSGSMAGASIDAARRALFGVLDELRPDDRFSFGRFGSRVEQAFSAMQPVAAGALSVARNELHLLNADMGGTEMNSALLSTLALKGATAAPAVLLITDGKVWDIDRVVEAALRGHQRIFAIGVGSAPSESLLRLLTERTGGACDIVPPGEDMVQAVMRMFRRIRQQGDMHASVEWGAQPLWQAPLPEAVFAGDTVHLMAAFPRGRPVQPLLTLRSADEVCHIQAPAAQRCEDADVARLAAARSTRALAGSALQDWAVRYQLLSEATHMLLVMDRELKSDKPPRLERIRHTAPADLVQTDFMICADYDAPPTPERVFCSRSFAVSELRSFDEIIERARLIGAGAPKHTDAEHAELRALIEALALQGGDWVDLAEALLRHLKLPELRALARICEPDSPNWPFAVLALLGALNDVRPLSRYTQRLMRAAFKLTNPEEVEALTERLRHLAN